MQQAHITPHSQIRDAWRHRHTARPYTNWVIAHRKFQVSYWLCWVMALVRTDSEWWLIGRSHFVTGTYRMENISIRNAITNFYFTGRFIGSISIIDGNVGKNGEFRAGFNQRFECDGLHLSSATSWTKWKMSVFRDTQIVLQPSQTVSFYTHYNKPMCAEMKWRSIHT